MNTRVPCHIPYVCVDKSLSWKAHLCHIAGLEERKNRDKLAFADVRSDVYLSGTWIPFLKCVWLVRHFVNMVTFWWTGFLADNGQPDRAWWYSSPILVTTSAITIGERRVPVVQHVCTRVAIMSETGTVMRASESSRSQSLVSARDLLGEILGGCMS